MIALIQNIQGCKWVHKDEDGCTCPEITWQEITWPEITWRGITWPGIIWLGITSHGRRSHDRGTLCASIGVGRSQLVTWWLVGYLVVSDGVPRPVQVIRHEVDEINCIAQALSLIHIGRCRRKERCKTRGGGDTHKPKTLHRIGRIAR